MIRAPRLYIKITDNLFCVDGDIFSSRMQTLTITVNTVGVMGKGIALDAKNRFPDVYATYKKACHNKLLVMGRPYLYKRESFLDNKSDDYKKWFLLFPTKEHWRNKSNIDGIEKGLKWLLENYKKEGIESLAVPALGCGLGGLDWKEVAPLMCRYFVQMDIPVEIYLPQGKNVSNEYLKRDFLIR